MRVSGGRRGVARSGRAGGAPRPSATTTRTHAPPLQIAPETAAELTRALAAFFDAVTPPERGSAREYVALAARPDRARHRRSRRRAEPTADLFYTLAMPAQIRADADEALVARDLAAMQQFKHVARAGCSRRRRWPARSDIRRTTDWKTFFRDLTTTIDNTHRRARRSRATGACWSRPSPTRAACRIATSSSSACPKGIFPQPAPEDPLLLDSERAASARRGHRPADAGGARRGRRVVLQPDRAGARLADAFAPAQQERRSVGGEPPVARGAGGLQRCGRRASQARRRARRPGDAPRSRAGRRRRAQRRRSARLGRSGVLGAHPVRARRRDAPPLARAARSLQRSPARPGADRVGGGRARRGSGVERVAVERLRHVRLPLFRRAPAPAGAARRTRRRHGQPAAWARSFTRFWSRPTGGSAARSRRSGWTRRWRCWTGRRRAHGERPGAPALSRRRRSGRRSSASCAAGWNG